MCGRYLFSINDNKTLQEILHLIQGKVAPEQIKTGEIFPEDYGMVILKKESQIELTTMRWGFHIPGKKRSVINARVESFRKKPLFYGCERCVIPASGFYEWDQKRQKHLFTPQDKEFFMAGLWHMENMESHFVILTTSANSSVAPIHFRMPIWLTKSEITAYLYHPALAQKILDRVPPVLTQKVV